MRKVVCGVPPCCLCTTCYALGMMSWRGYEIQRFETALIRATWYGRRNVVAELIEKYKADVNISPTVRQLRAAIVVAALCASYFTVGCAAGNYGIVDSHTTKPSGHCAGASFCWCRLHAQDACTRGRRREMPARSC